MAEQAGVPVLDPVEVEDEAERDEETDVLPPYTIVSYGADYDVRGLVSRLESEDIEIPGFQRGFVWTRRQAARFIESLLLGLPVPGIFLWRDPSTQKLHVIDGQQRLRTLLAFYQGVLQGREFKVPDRTSPYQVVHPRFQNKTYRRLEDEDRRRLDNSIIHATIINQERPPSDDSSIYYIFERLNTEGTPLQPQEIRSAVFRGPLLDLLAELNENESWRSLYGSRSPRMKDRELVLRFFALFHADLSVPTAEARNRTAGASYAYARPMKEFLNRYCQLNGNLDLQSRGTLTNLFEETVSVVASSIGPRAFRPGKALNAAVFDAVMVGIGRRLQRGPFASAKNVKTAYEGLLKEADFVEAYSRATADHESVKKRIELADRAFADVP